MAVKSIIYSGIVPKITNKEFVLKSMCNKESMIVRITTKFQRNTASHTPNLEKG